MPIPATVTQAELNEAVKPLCDLLGTSPKNYYDAPGMTISHGEVVFTVPASHEENPHGRAPGVRALHHPQGNAAEELVYVVRVAVVRP